MILHHASPLLPWLGVLLGLAAATFGFAYIRRYHGAMVDYAMLPLAREVEMLPGEIQQLTPSVDALYTPNIDEALDEESAKREFWRAFRVLGDWYSDFPPY